MKFHEFAESKHFSTNISIQIDYHPRKQAYINALSKLIGFQRSFLMWASYPLILTQYALVSLHILKQPMKSQDLIKDYNDKAQKQADLIKAREEAEKGKAVQTELKIVDPA